MKKSFFTVLSLILSFCFILSGCNLFIEDNIKINNQIAISAEGITITREEFVKGYNNYFETFYNNNNQDKEKAMDKLIDYLVSKKIFIKDAESLIESGEIEITDVENNYLWYSVYTALIRNIETFEEEIKKELNIEEEKEKEEDKEKDEDFAYEPYTKTAKIVKNEETGKYEIVIIKYVLNEKINNETGEREYDYIPEEEFINLDIDLLTLDKIIEMIDNEKLFLDKTELSDEEKVSKSISKEAIRRYIHQLKENEKGKKLSTDKEEIYLREIDRIYKIVYENFLINKIYDYKVSSINIKEEDILNKYLEKAKQDYEKFLLDIDKFSEYSSKLKDVYYIPETEEEFFYTTHLLIKLSEEQVQQINTLKQAFINGEMEEEEYEIEYNKITDKSKIKLSERDREGNIIIEKTDEKAISLEEMLQNLENDLNEIDNKYEATVENTNLLSNDEYYNYIHERADKFFEYMYRYGEDPGSAQGRKKNYFGEINEDWYLYTMGSDEKDLGFVESFVEKARELFQKNHLSNYSEILMENWQTADEVETLYHGSTGYSIIFYAGKVKNIFESFDEKKFNIEDLPEDALQKMDYQRLGLTMNKTLFDLMYENVYEEEYKDIIKIYEEEIIKNIKIIKNKKIYNEFLKR